jgi:hypothetical protein
MFEHIKIRCSSLGYLMTEPRGKKEKDAGELSETAKTHLTDVYVSERYGRNTDITTKYTEKGLMVEEDSITLYCRLKKKFLKKNEQMVQNPYIKGTPDLYEGMDILAADKITDIKSSWDLYTFSRVRTKPINDQYWWQLQGYMWLTGAKTSTLAYCLVNTPEILISDEKRRLLWKMGVISEEDSTYQQACEELDKAMRFDDIPMEERVIPFQIERDDAAIAMIAAKVMKGRQFLQELHEVVTGKNVLQCL